jgi:antibiotic biosynthesis monooxygenase (ABM) superfamily enzyme
MAHRIITTLVAWLIAYLVVTLLLLVAGPQLQSTPVPVRALLISGVLVTVMTNFVMPLLSRVLLSVEGRTAGVRR